MPGCGKRPAIACPKKAFQHGMRHDPESSQTGGYAAFANPGHPAATAQELAAPAQEYIWDPSTLILKKLVQPHRDGQLKAADAPAGTSTQSNAGDLQGLW